MREVRDKAGATPPAGPEQSVGQLPHSFCQECAYWAYVHTARSPVGWIKRHRECDVGGHGSYVNGEDKLLHREREGLHTRQTQRSKEWTIITTPAIPQLRFQTEMRDARWKLTISSRL